MTNPLRRGTSALTAFDGGYGSNLGSKGQTGLTQINYVDYPT